MKRILPCVWWLAILLALPVFGVEPQLVVAPFQASNSQATTTGLETVLQDLLIARLSRAASVAVLDRDKINVLLKEHQLSLSGLVDPAIAAKTGKLIGADFVVLGSFNLAGGKLQVHARVVSVATAAIIAAQEVTTPPGELIALGDQLGARLLEGLQLKADKRPVLSVDLTPDVTFCFMRGVALFMSAQYDAAQGQFLKARQLNPQNLDALLWSGRSYLAQKTYAHAALSLSQFIPQAAQYPELGQAQRWLAECQEHLTPEDKQFLGELQKGIAGP